MRQATSTEVLLALLARLVARNAERAFVSFAPVYERVPVLQTPRSEQRRIALVAILHDRAEWILDRVVADALRATDFVGLGHGVAQRYALTARRSLPVFLGALGASDPERERILRDSDDLIKQLIALGIPKFVQRSLVAWGFKAAYALARDGAPREGFDPDELEDELRVFQRAFEARFFYSL